MSRSNGVDTVDDEPSRDRTDVSGSPEVAKKSSRFSTQSNSASGCIASKFTDTTRPEVESAVDASDDE
jgi:hypothetical protein